MLKIVIDSREQNPFGFIGYEAKTQIQTLQTGDYSLFGATEFVTVERKSLSDLIMCLSKERDRFIREMERLRAFQSVAVIVESPLSSIVAGDYRARMEPEAAFQSVIAISERYRLPFWFCNNRAEAERITFHFLRHFQRHTISRYKALADKIDFNPHCMNLEAMTNEKQYR